MIKTLTKQISTVGARDHCDEKKNIDDFKDKYTETPWTIIESYFSSQHLKQLVRHQIESYNDFITYQIQRTIQMFNPVSINSEQDYDKELNKYKLEILITFENFSIYRPQIHENNGATKIMFPHEARLRNFTYASNMTVDINIKYIVRSGPNLDLTQTFYKILPKIHIGKLPIMLKSNICVLNQYKHVNTDITGECKMDPGGYFIINGSEKTVLGQERAAENQVSCFNISKNNTKWAWLAEIKSIPDTKCISPKQISLVITSKRNEFGYSIFVNIPRVRQPIPLFIVFRALNILTDKEICETIVLDIKHNKNTELLDALKGSIIESNTCLTYELAIKHITSNVIYTPFNMDKETGYRKKREFALEVLKNDLFPHCHNHVEKIYFLGYMTNQLLQTSLGWQPCSDRDSYLNKRIDLTGSLLNNLFRNYFNKLVKDMQKQVIREINNGSWKSTDDYNNIINLTNIYKIIKSTTIENGLKRALATGDFGIKQINSNKVGVAQVLNRLTYCSSLSHLRRINTPIDKSGKLIPPRKLHNSSWGFLCPAETPEGASVGIVKNLSYMTHVTIPSNSTAIYEYVKPYVVSLDMLKPDELFTEVKVFINGAWIGITKDPINLYNSLRSKKSTGIMNIYTSIVFDYKKNEIKVCNDAGRLTRPLLRVKNNNILLTNDIVNRIVNKELRWDDLLLDCKIDEAVIEYIDSAEQNFSMISVNPGELTGKQNLIYKYTHCEIHPSTIFGIIASCIPFPEHNQSPRNTYQSAMGKQAMGVYVTNYDSRMDKTAYVLNYPMRPLVDTRIMDLIQLNQIPSGSQVVVAIMTHTGYNQEDSLLFNKGSIDRGLFQATIYHTEKDEDKKIHGDAEIRCKPDKSKTKGMKFGNYDKIGANGVVPENTLVKDRDIIIAKVLPIKENRNDPTKVIKYEDQSRIIRTNEETYIDKNYIERNGDGYNFCKVRLRNVRKPVIGDKFSSRHGQKGTIGNIIPEADMPFTAGGLKPDIIINPHAIPSRMTIGQLKETLLGKVLLELGLFGDGTSFGNFDIKDICKKLQKLGYESNGNELLYNGQTGEQIETNIFIGPAFYQRLKHMVADKQHSRSIGPMVNLTRQPAEGRSRDGGLRFGEMERDCECGDTLVALNNGLSIKIKNMSTDNFEVLGWDRNENGLMKAKQNGFLYKGERECIQITMEDGRKNICTPEHPILTYDNEWVKAKDLIVGETRVKASVNYPELDIDYEIQESKGWVLAVGDIILQTDCRDEYLKTLAFARIIGLLITDGSISIHNNCYRGIVYLGHALDVETFLDDLELFCEIRQTNFVSKNLYFVNIPSILMKNIVQLPGILVGRRVTQKATLPEFVLSSDTPKPIIREFLGGLFGGDGHTCVLSMHRGKRDILTSVSFSQTKKSDELDSLKEIMEQIKSLFARFNIMGITLQKLKETSYSKNKRKIMQPDEIHIASFQMTLHLDINELIPFSERVGFRYCCHKSQRLEAGVSYKRLRNIVTRQHNWIVSRVHELTDFKNRKQENPHQIIHTKDAIKQAVCELKECEPLIHEYAIPTTHDITDHLIKGTVFGKFRSNSFPGAEVFLEKIGALSWFKSEERGVYGVNRNMNSLPTMNLKVIDIRPIGKKDVYDIQVDNVHSFLANGVVVHNCMVSHGAARFTKGRLYDASDAFSVYVCNKCGLIAQFNDEKHIHECKTCSNRADFSYVEIPYACKLMFQELITMNIAPRIMT